MAVLIGVKEGKEVWASWPSYQEVKLIDPDKRRIEFVASDESIDRDREIIRASGWSLSNYKKNPVFLYAHNAHGLPIGRADCVWVDSDKLKATVRFTNEETGNPLGEAVYRLYENKFLNTVSVGFIGLDSIWQEDERMDPSDRRRGIRREFLKQELLEISAVPVPANPNAVATRELTDFDTKDIREELGWMRGIGILDEAGLKFLTEVYDFLENRKTLYYPIKQCVHIEPCEEVIKRGECLYRTEGEEGEQKEVTDDNIREEKQFEIQTLIFPKAKWNSIAEVKRWAEDHGFRTDKVDESSTNWRLRQQDPDDFKRLRTICLNPGRSTPMSSCKVKAVGGPKKEADLEDHEYSLDRLAEQGWVVEEACDTEASAIAEEVDTTVEEKRIVGKRSLPLADRARAWDAAGAKKRVAKWASSDGSGDKDKIKWSKYGQAFIVLRNPDESDNLGSYALPFADVINGTLTAVPRGLFASAAVLMGARGGANLSEADRTGAKNFVSSYYKRMGLKPPWARQSSFDLEEFELYELLIDHMRESEKALLEIVLNEEEEVIADREKDDLIEEEAFVSKRGAVLSNKNKQRIQQAIDNLIQVLREAESGETMISTDVNKDEPEDEDDDTIWEDLAYLFADEEEEISSES